MDLAASLQAGLGHCFKEPFPIRVILENRLLPITPVHDMINRSRVFEPKFSGHASHATQPREMLSITWSDPFLTPFRPGRRVNGSVLMNSYFCIHAAE